MGALLGLRDGAPHARRHLPSLLVCLRLRLTCACLLLWALPALAQGPARLSRDLQAQVAAGAGRMQVLVHGNPAEVTAIAARHGVRIVRLLHSGAVLEAGAAQVESLRGDSLVDHISGNSVITLSSDFRTPGLEAPIPRPGARTLVPVSPVPNPESRIPNPLSPNLLDAVIKTIGADTLWQGTKRQPGVTGKGVGIAIIDSGIWAKHPALRGHVVAAVDFTDEVVQPGADRFGHGTHVAGIIGGSADGFSGVAPGAHLVSLKVIGADGSGLTSDAIEAIDWAIAHKNQYAIRVLNLSFGHPPTESYRTDPLCEAVKRAVDAGLVVVASAGNNGKDAQGRPVARSIESPGISPDAITVGAMNTQGTADPSDDTLASWSGRGPTWPDNVMKPDLVAPGVKLTSTESFNSLLALEHPDWHVNGTNGAGYLTLSGTSMATAVVSGAVALYLEFHSEVSSNQVRLTNVTVDGFRRSFGNLTCRSGDTRARTTPRNGAQQMVPTASGDTFLSDTIVWGSANAQTLGYVTSKTIVWGSLLIDPNNCDQP